MSRKELTDVKFELIKIDAPRYQAILFVIDGKDVWLPRSLIEVDEDVGVVTLPEWLAIQKELV